MQIRVLLQTRCGLHFKPEQEIDFIKGVHQAMQTSGYHDSLAYYTALHRTISIDEPIWKHLVEELTIGETYFFRDSWQFKALREDILPPLIQQRRREGNFQLRIWSAGCSSGEEPYSLAILLHELIPDIEFWRIQLLATDINQQALHKARTGVYGNWSFRMETPLAVRDRYFREQDNRYELLPHIRQMVRFQYLNLVEDVYPSTTNDTINLDMIICRNVTIYFDRPTTKEIVNRFHRALNEQGWLIVGHSEPLASIYGDYQVVNFTNTVVYRKPKVTVTPAPPTPIIPLPPVKPVLANFEVKPPQKLSPKEQAEKLESIYQLLAKRQLEAARQSLNQLLEVMPDHTDALFLLAKIAADEGQSPTEIHHILDSLDQLNPLVPQSHYLRALLHQQGEQWADAKSSLRRALYADRDFVLAHYYMGELLYTEGNVAMAKRSWQNALNLLGKMPPSTPLPFGDGMVAGTLTHAIEQRMKRL